MGLRGDAAALFFLVLASATAAYANVNGVYDVTKYGRGRDITSAMLKAFKEACSSEGTSTVLVPEGEYGLREVKFQGPCNGPIEFRVRGVVKASQDPATFKGKDSWITFNYMDQFTLSGGGTFDGQGMSAWKINDCHKNSKCAQLPISLRFNFITNATVRDITSLNSKNFHVNVIGCRNLDFINVKILAPAESLNTDGIHMGRSDRIGITHSLISTGDDCISIGDGTKNLEVKNVTCGPGHGISVGSLGKYENEEPVSGITIKNCTLHDTDNGLRIKTWPSTPGNITVSHLRFEDIVVKNVGNPIIVDQEYCPWNLCKLESPSKIKISHVRMNNIRGTSSNKDAVKLFCSSGKPCHDVEIGNIDIKYPGSDRPATFQCKNVKPKVFGVQEPAACSSPVTASKL